MWCVVWTLGCALAIGEGDAPVPDQVPRDEVEELAQNAQQLDAEMRALAEQARALQAEAAVSTARAADEARAANEDLMRAFADEVSPERIADELVAAGALLGDDREARDEAVRVVREHLTRAKRQGGDDEHARHERDAAAQHLRSRLTPDRMARIEDYARVKEEALRKRSAERAAEMQRVTDGLHEKMRVMEQEMTKRNATIDKRLRSFKESQGLMRQLEQYKRMSGEMGRKQAAAADEYRRHAEELERAVRDRMQGAFDDRIKQRHADVEQLDHAKLAREAMKLAERYADGAKRERAGDAEATAQAHKRDREEAVRRLVRDHADKVFEEGGRFLNEARQREAQLKRRLGSEPRKAAIEKAEQRVEQLERELIEMRARLKELRQSEVPASEAKPKHGVLHV